jgi:hypothetical protein
MFVSILTRHKQPKSETVFAAIGNFEAELK